MYKFFDKNSLWLTLLTSACLFFLICGPSILNPLNDAWLLGGGDLTQQYFGWAFFRNGPWTIPVGLNPMYGMDISSSIVFSDGNPLLSLLLKPLNNFLPPTFQFQGAWILICFLMQTYFAWNLLGLFTKDHLSQALGSTLFIFVPPLLFRVGVHTNLAAHFLILGALYLNLRPTKKNQSYQWLGFLLISLGIHFYIFMMVFALWLADLCDRAFSQRTLKSKTLLTSLSLTLAILVFFAWQFGYFSVNSPSLFGYGFFKANILGILNSNGWSYFIKDIPMKNSWGEGNLYLGLGIIFLIICGFSNFKFLQNKTSHIKKFRFLLIILLMLVLFSITNQIGIGPLELQIPLPKWLLSLFGILRHSARLFWPAYYGLLILGCALILQGYKLVHARIILAICLSIQIVDLSVGLSKLHTELNSSIPNEITSTPLRQPFWKIASQRYDNVYLLPSRSNPNPDFMSRFSSSDWKIFGRYAAINKLNTNAVYLSRYDNKKQDAAFSKGLITSSTGRYDPKTLYIIKNEDLIPVALGIEDKKIFLASIDGFNILAPSLLESTNEAELGTFSKVNIRSLIPKLNQEISFRRSGSELVKYALTKDWNNQEDWGVWSGGKNVELTLPLPADKAEFLILNMRAFVNGVIPQQIAKINCEGAEIGEYVLTKFEDNVIKLQIPPMAIKRGYISLNFELPKSASPSSLGIDSDDRILGVGIVSATFK